MSCSLPTFHDEDVALLGACRSCGGKSRVGAYVPTREELEGESWEYCYGDSAPILPPKDDDEHHQ